MKTLSFRELSALASAIAVAVAAWLYFPDALMLASHPVREMGPDGNMHVVNATETLVRFAIGGVMFLVAMQVVFHIVLAIILRRETREPRDERDRLVMLKARRYAYEILAAGVVIAMAYLFSHDVLGVQAAQYLLMALFASEFVRYSLTFVYYRLSV